MRLFLGSANITKHYEFCGNFLLCYSLSLLYLVYMSQEVGSRGQAARNTPSHQPNSQEPAWDACLISNPSVYDPFKEEKEDEGADEPCFQPREPELQLQNFKSFFSGDSQMGEMPQEIPSVSSLQQQEEAQMNFSAHNDSSAPERIPKPKKRRPPVVREKPIYHKKPGKDQQSQEEYEPKQRKTKKIIKHDNVEPVKATKVVVCKCKKMQCLKGECQCSLNGTTCKSECACGACENREDLAPTKKPESISSQKKSQKQKQKITPGTGCGCQKSNCMKKYCQCFNKGKPCNENCKCSDCHNHAQH